MCIFTANKMCATLEKIFNLVYYYRNYRSKMFAGIDFTSGDTEVLSKKAFRFNKTLLGVLILAAALLLAGCGGAKSTRAKADETVHTALFDFTCGQAEVIDSYNGIDIPEGDKLVQFHVSVTNTSDSGFLIFKDDFQQGHRHGVGGLGQGGLGQGGLGRGVRGDRGSFCRGRRGRRQIGRASCRERVYLCV